MKGTCSYLFPARKVHELTIKVARVIQFREIERLIHFTHFVNDVTFVIQLYNE